MSGKKGIAKKRVGRPTLFKSEYCKQATKLCLLGATDKELADFFEIEESTLNNWKIAHPEFVESIKKGKSLADAEVANKLFKRATGYSHPDVDVKVIEKEVVLTPLIKHYPPDSTAAIFWLKNRRKAEWRDKVEQDITSNGQTIAQTTPLNDSQVEKILTALRNKKNETQGS